MANVVKRKDATSRQWSARLTLLWCTGVLALLVTQLPHPAQVLDALTGSAPSPIGAGSPLAAVQSILLMTAALVTWLIVGWALAVLLVGAIARLPGGPGHRARRLLPRIAPASIGRLVAAAVGVSLMAGTAACAAPGGSSAAGGVPAAVAGADPTTASASAHTGDPDHQGSITIDWPDPTPATSTTPSAPTPSAPTTTAPTTTAPTTTAPTTTASATVSAPPAAEPAATAEAAAAPAPPPTPDPPASDTTASDPPASDPPDGGVESVTVRSGDSLWRIAAHSLGSDATDTDIDNAWRAWYFANQPVIGDDPDQIVPGQSLVAPAPDGQVRS